MKHPLLTSLLLAALFLLTACGGGGSGQSSAPGKAGTKTGAKAAKGGDKWPDNELTKLLPKPDFALQNVDYRKGKGREILSLKLLRATREQIQVYADKFDEAGFKRGRIEVLDKEHAWGYHGTLKTPEGNCYVNLTWSQSEPNEAPETLLWVERVFEQKKENKE